MKFAKLITLVAVLNSVTEAAEALTATMKKLNRLHAIISDLQVISPSDAQARELLARAQVEAKRRKELYGGKLLDHATAVLIEQRDKAIMGVTL